MFPTWQPTSEYFHLARATGLQVRDYQNAICVNQVGLRFYDETKDPVPQRSPAASVRQVRAEQLAQRGQ
jgi:hypothetical protein